MIAGAGVGLLRTLYASRECAADLVPVDAVINAMCVAAAAVSGRCGLALHQDGSHREVPVVHCTASQPITWGFIESGALKYIRKHPYENMFW